MKVNILKCWTLLEDCPNPPRSNKCTPSFIRSNRGSERERPRKREVGEIREKERMSRTGGVGSRGYYPDRTFPGTRTWPTSEGDQYGLCKLLHPTGTTCRPCTIRTHPLPSDENDGERPSSLLARVRRLSRARAPV